MGDYFQDMRRRELGEAPNSLRMARYLIDIGLFEDNIGGEWPREPQPACPDAVKNLQKVVVLEDGVECSICLMKFKKEEVAKSMPCHHLFHEMCLLTWLNQNNTCPFCRFKLAIRRE